jgi:hypothetical protein
MRRDSHILPVYDAEQEGVSPVKTSAFGTSRPEARVTIPTKTTLAKAM